MVVKVRLFDCLGIVKLILMKKKKRNRLHVQCLDCALCDARVLLFLFLKKSENIFFLKYNAVESYASADLRKK